MKKTQFKVEKLSGIIQEKQTSRQNKPINQLTF